MKTDHPRGFFIQYGTFLDKINAFDIIENDFQ